MSHWEHHVTHDDFESVVASESGADTRFVLLRVFCRLSVEGQPVDDVVLSQLARRFARPIGDVTALYQWVRKLGDSSAAATHLRFCKGVCCTANGAELVRKLILDTQKALGGQAAVESTYCLEQCDQGPSIAIGRDIYTGSEDKVIVDSRSWHSKT